MEKQTEIADVLLPQDRSIYLAGPFFNKHQIGTLEEIEKLCLEHVVVCNSPRKFLVLKPKASWEERKQVFLQNLSWIQQSEVMVACLDNPANDGTPRPTDTGTLWEMGYAYAIGRPVVCYTGGTSKINVMLAQGCRGFLKGPLKIAQFLEGKFDLLEKEKGCQEFDWEVAEAWKEEIF